MKDGLARVFAQRALGVRGGPTLRQVATGCLLPHQSSGGNANKQFMFRSAHFMRAKGGVSALQFALPNFYVAPSGGTQGREAGPGGTATWTASIEYPSGTVTQVTFAAAASATVADGGMLTSDLIPVRIPEGALFWVRGYYTNASGGILYYQNGNNPVNRCLGETSKYGASGITDETMSASTTMGSDFQTMLRPAAIIGYSDTPAVAVVGDSRVSGIGDTPNSAAGMGSICRTLEQVLPVLNLSTGGNAAYGMAASSAARTNRVALAAYATSAIMQVGINDVSHADSLATIQANIATVKAAFPTMPWWGTTKEPSTTSTDSWVTTANQTVSGNEAVRLTLNTWVRGVPSGWQGYLELADAVESARSSGFWKNIGGLALTADGLHATQRGYLEPGLYGAVNPGLFT